MERTQTIQSNADDDSKEVKSFFKVFL